ncbi:MAG: nitroreductase family deazaflavin-dependent oxidoreductase [Dehalococcoidia bacterium]
MKFLMRLFLAVHVGLYRLTGGRIGARFMGGDVLILTTVGRRTGKRRSVPLIYLRDGDQYVVVASNGGSPTHPGWFHNATASGEATIEVGDRRMRTRARQANEAEHAALWPRLVAIYKGYADYQAKTRRQIPLVILDPTG